jgi:hypothetical protein
VPAAPKRVARSGLRALVPSAVRAEGEAHPWVRTYKEKWLSRIDFKSDPSIESLLLLAFVVLALGRDGESEVFVNQLLRYVDMKRASDRGKRTMATTPHLGAWLKAKRGLDVTPLLVRARELDRSLLALDREWLSAEAGKEIDNALAKKRLDDLLRPLSGVMRWMNEDAARPRAEALLERALAGMRALMDAR